MKPVGKIFKIKAGYNPNSSSIGTEITWSGPKLSAQTEQYLLDTSISTHTQLGLELFISKILLARYNCRLGYTRDEESGRNLVRINFPKS